MLSVIEKEKALPIVSKYFDMLASMGYVKHPTVRRFLIYLFLIDFTEWVYPFLTDCDYNLLDKALVKIFTDGGCLLPYQVIQTNRDKVAKAYVGVAHYSGLKNILRRTEVGALRSVEDKSELRNTEQQ